MQRAPRMRRKRDLTEPKAWRSKSCLARSLVTPADCAYVLMRRSARAVTMPMS